MDTPKTSPRRGSRPAATIADRDPPRAMPSAFPAPPAAAKPASAPASAAEALRGAEPTAENCIEARMRVGRELAGITARRDEALAAFDGEIARCRGVIASLRRMECAAPPPAPSALAG